MRNNILYFIFSILTILVIGVTLVLGITYLMSAIFISLILNGSQLYEAGLILLIPNILGVALGGILAIVVSYFFIQKISFGPLKNYLSVKHPNTYFIIALLLSPLLYITANFMFALIWGIGNV